MVKITVTLDGKNFSSNIEGDLPSKKQLEVIIGLIKADWSIRASEEFDDEVHFEKPH